MVNVRKFVKPYQEAGALHSLFAPHRFVDDRVFLAKGNQLGIALAIEGVDEECLTEATLEAYTRRMAAAWRSFDDRFRLYQYLIKQDQVPLEQGQGYSDPVIEKTVRRRTEFLAAKPQGLYSIRLFYVVLLEPRAFRQRHGLSSKHAVQTLGTDLHRRRTTLVGHIESFQEPWAICWASAFCPKPRRFSSCACSATLIRILPRLNG